VLCDRTAYQLPDVLQAALSARISRVSIQNISKSLSIAPRHSAIGTMAAGWLTGYCFRHTNCTLWSSDVTQYHRYMATRYDTQYHRYMQCGSQHDHSIRHTVPPVHAVRFTAWPLDTTHSTTGTCSAVHSMSTRHDTQYHRYMQCGSQHEHST